MSDKNITTVIIIISFTINFVRSGRTRTVSFLFRFYAYLTQDCCLSAILSYNCMLSRLCVCLFYFSFRISVPESFVTRVFPFDVRMCTKQSVFRHYFICTSCSGTVGPPSGSGSGSAQYSTVGFRSELSQKSFMLSAQPSWSRECSYSQESCHSREIFPSHQLRTASKFQVGYSVTVSHGFVSKTYYFISWGLFIPSKIMCSSSPGGFYLSQ